MCKKHTILAVLRQLRADGYTGKINPAIVRGLTGIERTGTILCELRSDGCLIYAGTIHLPAHRGKTLANEYLINPAHDLMPKQHYDIGEHSKQMAMREKRKRRVCKRLNAYLLGELKTKGDHHEHRSI